MEIQDLEHLNTTLKDLASVLQDTTGLFRLVNQSTEHEARFIAAVSEFNQKTGTRAEALSNLVEVVNADKESMYRLLHQVTFTIQEADTATTKFLAERKKQLDRLYEETLEQIRIFKIAFEKEQKLLDNVVKNLSESEKINLLNLGHLPDVVKKLGTIESKMNDIHDAIASGVQSFESVRAALQASQSSAHTSIVQVEPQRQPWFNTQMLTNALLLILIAIMIFFSLSISNVTSNSANQPITPLKPVKLDKNNVKQLLEGTFFNNKEYRTITSVSDSTTPPYYTFEFRDKGHKKSTGYIDIVSSEIFFRKKGKIEKAISKIEGDSIIITNDSIRFSKHF